MREAARVTSLDALRDFKGAFVKFGDECAKALTEVDVEINRTRRWVEDEQAAFWHRELRRRNDVLEHAKADLRRIQTSLAERPPSAVEQKKAVALAEARRDEAVRKIAATKKWSRLLEREVAEYQGQAQQLAGALDAELPKAVGVLNRLIESLEAYLAIAPESAVAEQTASAAAGDAGSRAESETGDDLLLPLSTKQMRRLLATVPDQARRDATDPVGGREAIGAAIEHGSVTESNVAVPGHEPDAPGPLEKVVIADDAAGLPRFIMHRTEEQVAGDSGWFIGPLRLRGRPESLAGVRVLELLQQRPDLRGVLSLPRGYSLIIDRGEISGVYDARGLAVATAPCAE